MNEKFFVSKRVFTYARICCAALLLPSFLFAQSPLQNLEKNSAVIGSVPLDSNGGLLKKSAGSYATHLNAPKNKYPDVLKTQRASSTDWMVADHFIVRAQAGISETNIRNWCSQNAFTLKKKISDGLYIVAFDTSEIGQYTEKEKFLESSGLFSSIESDYLGEGKGSTPNDPYYTAGYEWGMDRIGMPQVWRNDVCAEDSIIVILMDTGIDTDHPDLKDKLWTNPAEAAGTSGADDDGNGYTDDLHGWNFAYGTNDIEGDHFHGTHLAGIIAASTNNGIGMASVCTGAKILPIKLMDSTNIFYFSDLLSAISYTLSLGKYSKIVNMSFGATKSTSSVSNAYKALLDSGFLVLVAAGNEGKNIDSTANCDYPACYTYNNIISIASSDTNGSLSSHWESGGSGWASNYGAEMVDLAAPGSNILSAYLGGGYEWWGGTSMATPYVTGVAALIKSLKPDWTAAQIKAQILESVITNTALQGKVLTGGELNAWAAVKDLLDTGNAAVPFTKNHSAIRLHTNSAKHYDLLGRSISRHSP